MRMRYLAVTAASFVVLGGCVQTQATMLGPKGQYPPVAPDQVQVFLDEDDAPATCTKIALINAQGESSFTNEAKMIEASRKKAGQVGANAVILAKINEPSAGAKIAGAFLGTGSQRRGQLVALRCPEPTK